ncbi:class I SAM-dependent methyltransferase [Candidatus Microgenomates bacterium]|nr:MAG: class I SAM-dependent methyltransferase [Candidatus Microgenomates bacterium]
MIVTLDLGCGHAKIKAQRGEKVVGVDYIKTKDVDVVANLEKKLPFKKNFCDRIYSSHVFEHIQNATGLIAECWRITKPTGEIFIRVPHFTSAGMFTDLTHKTFFSSRSLDFFLPGTYLATMSGFNNKIRFKLLEKRIICYPPYKFMEPIINFNDNARKLYEYLFCFIFPANEIIFRLKPIK